MWRFNIYNTPASSSLLPSILKIHTPFASKTTSLPSSTPPLCSSSSLTSSSISNQQVKHLFYYPKSAPVGNCSLNQGAAASDETPNFPLDQSPQGQQSDEFWSKWKANTGEMSVKLAKLGLAAVLAYGLFDAVTYTTFFVLAFLGYEKSTGKNPVANLQALLGIVILMWTGNNITRPFRVAGAAALAPFIDSVLKKIQNYFKFPRLVHAFALVVSVVAGTCLTVVGLLSLSRWGK